MALDPVCGMTVDPAYARFESTHAGTRHVFCAAACKAKFEADPQRYLVAREREPMDMIATMLEGRRRPAKPAAPKKPEPAAVDHAPAHAPAFAHDFAPRATTWICPMDPDVVSDRPGACPKCGMALEPASVGALDDANPELDDMRRRLKVSTALALPIVIYAMVFMTPGTAAHGWFHSLVSMRAMNWVQLVLSTPIVFWAGMPFFERGVAGLRGGRFNMFTLIALGVGAAWLFSAAATIAPASFPDALQHDGAVDAYFDTAAVITVLVLLGQVLELRARAGTSRAVRELLKLKPSVAHRVAGEHEEDVHLGAVRVGDRLRVRPGETVPVDGVVEEGTSPIDESAMTGEPLPVDRGPGDPVTGGTLNTAGAFVMRVEKVGDDTLLARIVAAVEQAQRTRAPIAKLADKVTQLFVPAVVAVAALAFLGWFLFGPEPRIVYALLNAVAVLIFACPCALGLATPTAVVVAMGRAARSGILVRDASALERAEKVDLLMFDKTGTLTEGKPRLTAVLPAPGVTQTKLLAAAASVETPSEHPIARAVVAAAKAAGTKVPRAKEFAVRVGAGASAQVGASLVRVGKAAFAEEEGASFEALAAQVADLASAGATVVYVAAGAKALGCLAVTDPIKATTHEAVELLRRMGIRMQMITGDDVKTARAVAGQLGIGQVDAGVDPERKQILVAVAQAGGRVVGMAGDGINDAPALARADVGIAMGTGTDVAIGAAAITLVKGDLRGVVRALELSRATMRTIRQNLFWAFFYNAVGLPFAAGAGAAIGYAFGGARPLAWLVSPMWASAAMVLSSLFVVGNSLRLRRA